MPMSEPEHRTIYLKDYRPPAYRILSVALQFDLEEDATRVSSRLTISRNESAGRDAGLVLDGRDLQLEEIRLDGRLLDQAQYHIDKEKLTIPQVPDSFELNIRTIVNPAANSSLEGLYLSSGNFCTQCEAEGFRKITWFLDRPDVMTVYTVTLQADKQKYPVLLSNGNLLAEGALDDERHYATWHDPFPKPAYLFALVGGRLVKHEELHVTSSGKQVKMQIYVEPHNRDKCEHAMQSLRKAMQWDEEVYGLECDLDQYMIVAVDDFNMGAMENKGLNVFNSKYVLASPETATDADYQGIEEVVAHEYFHNWTGNRVTCRDWFQLSLKEGLTVFRDQQFSAETIFPGVKRIHDVMLLRSRQFPEDNGPMAHPVRPDSYIEINNFYTLTIYEKGAEIIRMLHTLLGGERFVKGVRLYLARHDGTAATIDDFVAAMEEAGGRDLTRFKRWYSQTGTPELVIEKEQDGNLLHLHVRQQCGPTLGQLEKRPFHIPLKIGFIDDEGNELPLNKAGDRAVLLELERESQTFTFEDMPPEATVSLLRGFSAPVKIRFNYNDEQLFTLFKHDPDHFSRWEAGQRIGCRVLMQLVSNSREGKKLDLPSSLAEAFGVILAMADREGHAFAAQLLSLPSESYLAEEMKVIDVDAIHAAREFVRMELAAKLKDAFLKAYRDHGENGPYSYSPAAAGKRRLKNLALAYLMSIHASDPEIAATCYRQFENADNMSDEISALTGLVHTGSDRSAEALEQFLNRFRDNPLVMDKWLSVQATAPLPGTLRRVKDLMDHEIFSLQNPNKIRALIGAFAGGNPVCFHARDGEGYAFLADCIISLHRRNPQIAARLAANFTQWRRFDEQRRSLMQTQLQRILHVGDLSRDVYEVVSKSLV